GSAVGLRIDRDRRNTHFAASLDNANCDLSAIGNQNPLYQLSSHISRHSGRERAYRADAVNHNAGPANRLPGNLLIERIAIADAHKPSPFISAVYLRSMHGIDAESDHIARFGRAMDGVLKAV